MNEIVPNNEPYLLPGGDLGCLLLHGFTSMPEEMRPLGDYLAGQGFSVLGARLAGHATHPDDLKKTSWTDWLSDVQDGLAVLAKTCKKRVLIGQSLGGMIALTAAAREQVDAVVTLSTPYGISMPEKVMDWLVRWIQPTIHKKVPRFPHDHPLYRRRELNYPAYPEFPSRILTEVDRLGSAMLTALPSVTVPVLLIHSRVDHEVPFTSMQAIYDRLGSRYKEMVAIDGMGHSLVMDPQHQRVYEALERFLNKIGKPN
jgi:carboxylesterase